ncbi:hypothetical protein DL89DRAFT_268175 [Linderina pennispora]|uniref:DUF6593 domain-containing protein n=1 Tax=Linderina pennispora TaxID=61395 RepID=A0A1Y1W6J6_9FUNG|nr:uncharacterized protein DL89DRAFT_268175 [Linderina pennispora]ORX69170.1 hypothetical protein DL89DRAFT_268175 [Linderina pennispora]
MQLADTYTFFLGANKKDWVAYAGTFKTYADAVKSGRKPLNYYAGLSKVIVSSTDIDVDDDQAAIAKTAASNDIAVVATIDWSTVRKAEVTGLTGPPQTVEHRKKGKSWKMTVPSGKKYKWEIEEPKRRWRLCNGDEVIASFDSYYFWKKEPGYLKLHGVHDTDTKLLILASWGLVAKSHFEKSTIDNLNSGAITAGTYGLVALT